MDLLVLDKVYSIRSSDVMNKTQHYILRWLWRCLGGKHWSLILYLINLYLFFKGTSFSRDLVCAEIFLRTNYSITLPETFGLKVTFGNFFSDSPKRSVLIVFFRSQLKLFGNSFITKIWLLYQLWIKFFLILNFIF